MKTFETYIKEFDRWLELKNYAESSRKDYISYVHRFHDFCQLHQHDPSYKKEDAVAIFLHHRMEVEKKSWSTINCHYSALRLFYEKILNRQWNLRKLVLHTWGQNLSYHPHLHCLIPAGGWVKK